MSEHIAKPIPVYVDGVEREVEVQVMVTDAGAAVVERAYLEERTRRRLPRDLFLLQPFGRKILVVREPAASRYKGLIEIPKIAQAIPSIGWIISAGPLVGTPPTTMGHLAIHYSGPELVGRKVQFGRMAGSAVIVSEDDDETERVVRTHHGSMEAHDYEAPYLNMHDLDLWCEVPNYAFEEEG